jgi:hypothetical protein
MKKFNYSIFPVLAVAALFVLIGPGRAFAATTPPPMGSLLNYGVVSMTFTNSNTSPYTKIFGDVCATTQPTTVPLLITGLTSTPCAPSVGNDQTAAMANLNSQAATCTSILKTDGTSATNNLDEGDIDAGGSSPAGTYTAGCYSTVGAMNVAAGTVTLTGPGVFIFKSGGALTTQANTKVVLAGGASSDSVFWIPNGGTTIGAYTGTLPAPVTFVGNIFRGVADGPSITLGHFANLQGRALAFGYTVTTDANVITSIAPATLSVFKHVVNSYGIHNATASNFTVHVKRNGAEVSGSPQVGSESGTQYLVSGGTYAISENADPSYTPSFSGGCDSSGNVTVVGTTAQNCTITNNEIAPPPLILGIGGHEGTTSVTSPLIHVTKVPSPFALSVGGGIVTYTETVTNPGTVALGNVSLTDDRCGPEVYVSGDTNLNSSLDTTETWVYTCRANLTQTTTNTATAVGTANGLTARATAIATVVVASPQLPNTGFPPKSTNNPLSNFALAIIASVGVLTTLAIVFRKRKI